MFLSFMAMILHVILLFGTLMEDHGVVGFPLADTKASPSHLRYPQTRNGPCILLMARTTTRCGTTPGVVAAPAMMRSFDLSPTTTKLRMATTTTSNDDDGSSSYQKKPSVFLASLWGTGGMVLILSKAIQKLVPIAVEPFQQGAIPLSQVQLGIYTVTCLACIYLKGYKGFQKKFAPLVVKRSLTLELGLKKLHHVLLAPLYSMGLFYATKKRKIVGWCVTLGMGLIVMTVKRLPYPWRNIVDAGVVAGLSWGLLSMVVLFLKAWILGVPPDIDPALPKGSSS